MGSYGVLEGVLWGPMAVLWGVLWGRMGVLGGLSAVAMGWRCPCNDAVLPLGGSVVPILPYPCNDAVLPLGGSTVPIPAMTPCCR